VSAMIKSFVGAIEDIRYRVSNICCWVNCGCGCCAGLRIRTFLLDLS
jgi:hypothetical protein